MPKSTENEIETQALERLRRIGVSARLMRGGHCVIAQLPIGSDPFDSPAGAQRAQQIVFSVVGRDRIKCLRPRFLFALPLLRIGGCSSPADIEARIRDAWRAQVHELARAGKWLTEIGSDSLTCEGGSVMAFALDGEDPEARVRTRDGKTLILPSRGPLSGMTLRDPALRTTPANKTLSSAIDLEIALSTHLEDLARRERDQAARAQRLALVQRGRRATRIDGRRPHSVLLVGPRLVSETTCIESMRLRGYSVHKATSEQEALACFAEMSPELVLADVNLGRSEGIDLLLGLRELPGIEDVPVLLVDDHHRPERRDRARQIGALGYLTYPIDVSRIAARLATILDKPSHRRFTRYDQRLSVRVSGVEKPCLTASVGRGGMYLASDDDVPDWELFDCKIALPGVSDPIGVEAEVRYRSAEMRSGRGIGMRFHAFAPHQESLLIDYLSTLESAHR